MHKLFTIILMMAMIGVSGCSLGWRHYYSVYPQPSINLTNHAVRVWGTSVPDHSHDEKGYSGFVPGYSRNSGVTGFIVEFTTDRDHTINITDISATYVFEGKRGTFKIPYIRRHDDGGAPNTLYAYLIAEELWESTKHPTITKVFPVGTYEIDLKYKIDGIEKKITLNANLTHRKKFEFHMMGEWG